MPPSDSFTLSDLLPGAYTIRAEARGFTAAIVPARVVDITGRDVPPANPGAEFSSTLVLVQLPLPGYPVAADSGAQLVVSAALEIEATIEMPSLAGLTLVEARRVLDQLGLVLGNVQTRNDRPPLP